MCRPAGLLGVKVLEGARHLSCLDLGERLECNISHILLNFIRNALEHPFATIDMKSLPVKKARVNE
jgi:hypothetical protein